MSAAPNLLTIAEAAHVMRVSTRTVWRWIEAGDLQTVKLPSGRQRIPHEALVAMIAEPGDEEQAA